MISSQLVKQLRDTTGAGMMDAKRALEENAGDIEKAIDWLRKKGQLTAAKKQMERVASEGIIGSYIHSNAKVGVMVELNCETDFVARNDEFKALARDIAMHIAAFNPLYINKEEVPAEVIEKEIEIETERLQNENKPEEIRAKILQGKLLKYYGEVCLLLQPYAKDDSMTVADVITHVSAKVGEKIVVKRFTRFAIGS